MPDELVAYWQDLFANMKPGIHVLDVGTGNGVVAYLAQIGIGDTAKVVGIDFAEIDPVHSIKDEEKQQTLKKIQFIPNTAIESFATEDQFELITSNYAIEYAPLELALAKVKSLLAPNGQFVGIIHLKDGFAYNESKAGLKVYRDLLESLNIEDKLNVIADPQNLAGQFVRQTLFTELTGHLEKLNGQSEFQWLMEIMQPIANICQNAKLGKHKLAQQLAAEFLLNRQHLIARLEQQLAASCTKEQLETLCNNLTIDEYDIQPLSFDQKPVALELVFKVA